MPTKTKGKAKRRERSPSSSPEPASSTLLAPGKKHRFKSFHVLGSFIGRTRQSIYDLLEEHSA